MVRDLISAVPKQDWKEPRVQSSSSSYNVSQPGSKILVQISTTAPQTSICFHMPHLYQLLPVVLHRCLAWICREQSDISTYLQAINGNLVYSPIYFIITLLPTLPPPLFPYLLLFKYILHLGNTKIEWLVV